VGCINSINDISEFPRFLIVINLARLLASHDGHRRQAVKGRTQQPKPWNQLLRDKKKASLSQSGATGFLYLQVSSKAKATAQRYGMFTVCYVSDQLDPDFISIVYSDLST
jgi:hypothetical protein